MAFRSGLGTAEGRREALTAMLAALARHAWRQVSTGLEGVRARQMRTKATGLSAAKVSRIMAEVVGAEPLARTLVQHVDEFPDRGQL